MPQSSIRASVASKELGSVARMHKFMLAVAGISFGAVAAISGPANAAAAKLSAFVAAALADSGRTDADKAQDADRKPGEMVVSGCR